MSKPQENSEKAAQSPWAFRLMTVADIPIRIHFTFMLFLVWIAISLPGRQGIMMAGFVSSIFFCVLLHELGHALTARKYGVKTRDITLYPIGGVAMLQGRPKAREELWIALAGPAVNVVIAAVLGLYLLIARGSVPPIALGLSGRSFLEALFVSNVILVLFNMIPAFPMDGGRVLRALLAQRMPEAKATQIAGTIGQGFAIVIGLYALLSGQILLMLVAFFVFLGAGQEVSATVTRSFLQGHRLAEAMQVRFRTIPHGATMEMAAEMLLAGSQHDFPVTADEEVVGVLLRTDIAQGLASEGPSAYVAGFMRRDFKKSSPDVALEVAIDMFTREDPTPILVMDESDRLLGMVTQENLSEFIMLEHARQQGRQNYGYTA